MFERLLLLVIGTVLFTSDIFAQENITKGIKEKEGALIRSDTTQKIIYLMFTAHEYGEGIPMILETLDKFHAKASFFFTGDFIRNNRKIVLKIHQKGHYVGPHSDKHLLYCDWNKRDSLLLPLDSIISDLNNNIEELKKIGIPEKDIQFFMPPYEWYNKVVAQAIGNKGLTLVNFTPGTSSNADYTTPDMNNYISSDTILSRIIRYDSTHPSGLNGFHLLLHAGTDSIRKDKLYNKLPFLMHFLKKQGFQIKTIAK